MDQAVEVLRDARDKSVVLKTKVLKARSAGRDLPIIIFEGKTDVGPYESWIKKISKRLTYIPISATGKKQSLDFYSRVLTERAPWNYLIYFVVDRDFDELRGYSSDRIIFKTCCYSMESYLISTESLRSVLADEFECHEDEEQIEKILDHYKIILSDACMELQDINKRIYFLQNYNAGTGSKEERVGRFIDINLDGVKRTYKDSDLKVLIPLSREPTEQENAQIDEVFSGFKEHPKRFRGKYLLDFFLSWLCLLSEDRKSGNVLFSSNKNIRFGRAELTHRSLASRVDGPKGLSEFIENILEDIANKLAPG